MNKNKPGAIRNTVKGWLSCEYFIPVVTVLLFIAVQAFIYKLSFCFDRDIPKTQWPALHFVSIQMIAGLIYLVSVYFICKLRADNSFVLFCIITAGIIVRGMMLFSYPIMETDANRYLWDGAVTFSGENPYRYSPEEIVSLPDTELPAKIVYLKNKAGEFLESINSPKLRSNYPPVAQIFFAMAYAIKPLSMPAWHTVQFLCDLATLSFLILILRSINIPLAMTAIYWCNPMVIKEIFNSGHMDVLIFPFLAGSLYFCVKKRRFVSAVFLAIAAGVKIWPIMLFPVIFADTLAERKKLAKLIFGFAGMIVILFLPVFFGRLDNYSGYVAYTHSWECNDAFFKFMVHLTHPLFQFLGVSGITAKLIRRFAVMVMVVAIIYMRVKKYPSELFKNSLIAVSSIFLLSPAGFPWYYTWLVPLSVMVPNWAVLSLTLFLPMYYIRLYLLAFDQEKLFDNVIIWIEYMPVWILILMQWYKSSLPSKPHYKTVH